MKKGSSSFWSADEEAKKSSNLNNFCELLHNEKILNYSKNFNHLWKWSVKKPKLFWSKVWDFTKIKGKRGKVIIKKPGIGLQIIPEAVPVEFFKISDPDGTKHCFL